MSHALTLSTSFQHKDNAQHGEEKSSYIAIFTAEKNTAKDEHVTVDSEIAKFTAIYELNMKV